MDFYAFAFRRRRHYVFGLSVRPSEDWNTFFPTVHESIGPSDQPLQFCGMSVRLSGEVSGHLLENAWREWPAIFHAEYLGHLQSWVDYGHGLLISKIFALFWLSETGKIWGFRAFPVERM